MIYLFIHQNFPAQYRHLIRHLADQPGNSVYFATQPNRNEMPGINKITYTATQQQAPNCHPLTVDIDRAVRTGAAVADVCRMLQSQGVRPDLIIGHCGWGETLFIKDVFPDVPVLSYFEFYYHPNGADVNFDPEFSSVFGNLSRLRTRNAVNLMAFESADWGHTPTQWQRNLHPPYMRKRLTVVHEGVDTTIVKPDPKAVFKLPGKELTLSRKDEVITYVSRNLEPYRGFHIFMRALPEVLRRRPKAQVLIVGGDGVSYGAPAAPRSTYRETMLTELGASIDRNRVHFLGQLEYQSYLKVLQISSAHVYLTYPFILSWSCIEAMAAGCVIIGSATPPVLEVLKNRVNGLTVDFFSHSDLADRLEEVLVHKDGMKKLREAARKTAIQNFDLKKKTLPQWNRLLRDLIGRKRPRAQYP